MKIYISAPITGYDLDERGVFFQTAANMLEMLGHTPVNPMADVDITNPAPRKTIMRHDVELLLGCDAIILFGEWKASYGCQMELAVAEQCGIKVIFTPDCSQPKTAASSIDYQPLNSITL